ncbi:MAG: hypothetical protein AB8C02_00105 [Halioglobus sp.]
MSIIRVLTAIVFVSLSSGTMAGTEGAAEIDKIKQAAVDRCIAAATERYGAAEKPSTPKNASIGPKKGHKISIRVGEKRKKKVECYALSNGDVRFFTSN